MNFAESLEYLESLLFLGAKNSQANLKKVAARLGNPHHAYPVIHVAGTNGKGSVCALIASALRAGNKKVGLYTSPHLFRINERMHIGEDDISDDDFAKNLTATRNASEKENIRLTYFEALTLSAFKWFCEQSVDIAVIETGLGGRFDATNIVDEPLCSIITSIGLDHTQYLGKTIESIVLEKSGIIKKNCQFVLYLADKKVYNMFKRISDDLGALLLCDENAQVEIISDNLSGLELNVRTNRFEYNNIFVGLTGAFQAQNVLSALTALHAIGIPEVQIREGFRNVKWPCRYQYISGAPPILLDGAHNPDAAIALSASISAQFKDRYKMLVLGIMSDKDIASITSALTAVCDLAILTSAKSERSATPKNIAPFALCPTMIEPNVCQAMKKARQLSPNNGIIIVSGSLYLVSEISAML